MVLDLRLSFQKGLLGRVVPYFFADAKKIYGPGGLKDTIRQQGRDATGQHSTTRSDMLLLLWSCEELSPIMAPP